ncbi:Geranylgeranyl transferase type-1 subunit beta [Cichlidogyrus casuarinus]|uniref:Geranylgeranyl transferase type-1 subunit beta n=1 Tax=Cichlidogyrus casuarinus TaxID=1844966 RepID=A0ABD2QET4_9PLAT
MIYAGLNSLLILGDDLHGIDRASMIRAIKLHECSEEPGCFKASIYCAEHDPRFMFSAVASMFILDAVDDLDSDSIVSYLKRCLSYEGGFAECPYAESHVGITYCAIASLKLLSRLQNVFPVDAPQTRRLIKWLLHLQSEGFHGRTKKSDDTCYSFFAGASLRILQSADLVNQDLVLEFHRSTWDPACKAFAKNSSATPDPMHAYLSLSGLSILFQGRLTANPFVISHEHADAALPVDLLNMVPELNITERAYTHLLALQRKWKEI